MDHVLVKDKSGLGSWVLILGCPRAESHELYVEAPQVSGPTFAVCAACEHQIGINTEVCDLEVDWSVEAYPERLRCGFSNGNASNPTE
jgi:hypothetical protein